MFRKASVLRRFQRHFSAPAFPEPILEPKLPPLGVDKIAFTGSPEIGKKIQQASGIGNLKRNTLDARKRNTLDDVDLPAAVEWAHPAVYMHQGQILLIERANSTNYGLAAGIFGKDADKINYFVQGIRAGTVWVNCYNVLSTQSQFRGFRDSGIGREIGEYGLQQYTEVKNAVTSLPHGK